ncbi:ER membrane protein complex subunit 7 [Umbelopsis nana]
MFKISILLLSLLVTCCWAARLEGSIAQNSLIQDLGDLEPTASVLLNGGEYTALVQKDGKFIFPDVGDGNYFLEVQSVNYVFPKIRVDIQGETVKGAYSALGSEWATTGYELAHPFALKAKANAEYFLKREGFNVMNMFKNPMMLMMGLSAIMLFALPKMMAQINPEDMEEFNKAQVDAQKMMSVPGLGQILGAQSAQQTKRRK